jgi:DNA-binding response OmpR family regulator
MLTARQEEIDRVLGLELGADDYITKPFAARELISRIHAHLRRAYGSLSGSEATSQPEIRFGPYVIDRDRIRVLKGQAETALTAMEFKILVFLAEHEDQVFSRQQILQQTWDNAGYSGDERVVDVHIHHLRLKLEDDPNRPLYLKTVRGFGYSFVKKS